MGKHHILSLMLCSFVVWISATSAASGQTPQIEKGQFDKDGKFVTAWGERGEPGGRETRPNYFNVVHGIAADPVTRRIYVSDRGNRRMQVFDENGKFIDQWPFNNPSSVNFLYANGDGAVWAFEDPTAKVVKYDREGRLLYAWGSLGDYPGAFLNMHGASVDRRESVHR
jgi:tripartite motif-containing protein 71